jgi:hypothetical protein
LGFNGFRFPSACHMEIVQRWSGEDER